MIKSVYLAFFLLVGIGSSWDVFSQSRGQDLVMLDRSIQEKVINAICDFYTEQLDYAVVDMDGNASQCDALEMLNDAGRISEPARIKIRFARDGKTSILIVDREITNYRDENLNASTVDFRLLTEGKDGDPDGLKPYFLPKFEYPLIRYRIYSGDNERIDVIDFNDPWGFKPSWTQILHSRGQVKFRNLFINELRDRLDCEVKDLVGQRDCEEEDEDKKK